MVLKISANKINQSIQCSGILVLAFALVISLQSISLAYETEQEAVDYSTQPRSVLTDLEEYNNQPIEQPNQYISEDNTNGESWGGDNYSTTPESTVTAPEPVNNTQDIKQYQTTSQPIQTSNNPTTITEKEVTNTNFSSIKPLTETPAVEKEQAPSFWESGLGRIVSIILGLIGFVIGFCIYFAPSIVALKRGHAYKWVILCINTPLIIFAFITAGIGAVIAYIALAVWAAWPAEKNLFDPAVNLTGMTKRNVGNTAGEVLNGFDTERGR
jgi:hypothetical protein